RHTRSKRDWSSDVCSSDLRNSPDQSLPLDIRYLLQSVVSAFNPVQTIKKSLREIQKVHKVSDSELEKLIFDFDLGMNLQDKYPRSEERRVGKEYRPAS